MSQKELAKKAGVSRSTIQKAESGKSIEFDNLLRIAKALKLHPADLFLSESDRQDITYKSKLLLNKLFEANIVVKSEREKQ